MGSASASEALQEARAAADAQDYPRALERYVWVFDNSLAIEPSFYGVRLSYVLSEWADLAESYPPARQALQGKQQATLEALQREPTWESFNDLVRIGDALEQPQVAIEAFKQLHQSHPQLAARAIRVAWELLLEHGEAELCSAYIPDADARYDEIRSRHEQAMSLVGSGDERFAAWQLADCKRQVEVLATILREAGRQCEAESVEARFRQDAPADQV